MFFSKFSNNMQCYRLTSLITGDANATTNTIFATGYQLTEFNRGFVSPTQSAEDLGQLVTFRQ